MNVPAFQTRVGPDTESGFDDDFRESLSEGHNGLDNIQAHLYIDHRYVYYDRSLLKSGTLRTMGSIRVVLPAFARLSALTPQILLEECTRKFNT